MCVCLRERERERERERVCLIGTTTHNGVRVRNVENVEFEGDVENASQPCRDGPVGGELVLEIVWE